MRETGPVAKWLSSPNADRYISIARTLLGMMKERMKRVGLSQDRWRRKLSDGTEIEVGSIFGQDSIFISLKKAKRAISAKWKIIGEPFLKQGFFGLFSFRRNKFFCTVENNKLYGNAFWCDSNVNNIISWKGQYGALSSSGMPAPYYEIYQNGKIIASTVGNTSVFCAGFIKHENIEKICYISQKYYSAFPYRGIWEFYTANVIGTEEDGTFSIGTWEKIFEWITPVNVIYSRFTISPTKDKIVHSAQKRDDDKFLWWEFSVGSLGEGLSIENTDSGEFDSNNDEELEEISNSSAFVASGSKELTFRDVSAILGEGNWETDVYNNFTRTSTTDITLGLTKYHSAGYNLSGDLLFSKSVGNVTSTGTSSFSATGEFIRSGGPAEPGDYSCPIGVYVDDYASSNFASRDLIITCTYHIGEKTVNTLQKTISYSYSASGTGIWKIEGGLPAPSGAGTPSSTETFTEITRHLLLADFRFDTIGFIEAERYSDGGTAKLIINGNQIGDPVSINGVGKILTVMDKWLGWASEGSSYGDYADFTYSIFEDCREGLYQSRDSQIISSWESSGVSPTFSSCSTPLAGDPRVVRTYFNASPLRGVAHTDFFIPSETFGGTSCFEIGTMFIANLQLPSLFTPTDGEQNKIRWRVIGETVSGVQKDFSILYNEAKPQEIPPIGETEVFFHVGIL